MVVNRKGLGYSKGDVKEKIPPLIYTIDPTECPFREFRDNELGVDYWGMGPAAFRAASLLGKGIAKQSIDSVWMDDQTQPLPRSVRQYLHGWVRAENLAEERYKAEVAIFEENEHTKMDMTSIQLSHAQVLRRSSFCRTMLSVSFILERVEGLMPEHQWENFVFSCTDGWLPRYHIYAPGMRNGGGAQHRPYLSKNGCYLVRLFYLGQWRCVWVNDTVPVDASGAPLLPFSPLITPVVTKHPNTGAKHAMNLVSNVIQLWPLLICKAILKLLAPDMSADYELDNEYDSPEDEEIDELDITHCLTGGLRIRLNATGEDVWKILNKQVRLFTWDDDNDTTMITTKSKTTKKPVSREVNAPRRSSFTALKIVDTADIPPYILPGITPGFQMILLVTLIRDLPLKKPLPEPEIPLWKTYRWVDWARKHGLYEAYDCPRTRFLMISGLLKLSHAPHLLDVTSTESITAAFRDEQDKTSKPNFLLQNEDDPDLVQQDMQPHIITDPGNFTFLLIQSIKPFVRIVDVTFFPSMYQFTTTTSHASIRFTKAVPNKALDVPLPRGAPLYLQIDNYEKNVLRISIQVLNPRILFNCGVAITECRPYAYLVLERFEWFVDCEIAVAKAHVQTEGYDSLEISLDPGRHYCRLWVHSPMAFHIALLSESSLLLGSRDQIMAASVKECPWASRFLNNLGTSFNAWMRVNRSSGQLTAHLYDKDFMQSYQPDLAWDNEVVGYKRELLHWMFRKALESVLVRNLPSLDFRPVCMILRNYFRDPDFGFPPKPLPSKPLRDILAMDPCDCKVPVPEGEEVKVAHEELEREGGPDEKSVVSSEIMQQILNEPDPQHPSYICEYANSNIQCGLLKAEREKFVMKNEAATLIQACWRGAWARKCLKYPVLVSPDIIKSLNDNAFGNLEALSLLMLEFFRMYPGAKYAYSIASALSGMNGIRQYIGTSPITSKCKWVPFFHGVFYCHATVKVHLDVQCNLAQAYSTVNIYDNDTHTKLPQAYNSHITFDITPNNLGYTVMGHGTLNQALPINTDIHWQLTVLTSLDNVFHVCDNDMEPCKELTLPSASKLRVEEVYLPNKKCILGGIQIAVNKEEAVNFRAASSDPELEIEAVLKTTDRHGIVVECGKCSGKGELFWPFIQLAPAETPDMTLSKTRSRSQSSLQEPLKNANVNSNRSLKTPKKSNPVSAQSKKSATKVEKGKNERQNPENPTKIYHIEVTAPNGWHLNLAQWCRVKEIMNSPDFAKNDSVPKKNPRDKGKEGTVKIKDLDKDKSTTGSTYTLATPIHGDAFTELECSVANHGRAIASRDGQRDLSYLAEKKRWEAHETGRSSRCSQLRKEFRIEFLEVIPSPPSIEEGVVEEMVAAEGSVANEAKPEESVTQGQGPSPVTEASTVSEESEEETLFLTMPEQLKDKFIPLAFVPSCMKEKDEKATIILTPELNKEFEEKGRTQIEEANERTKQLQAYNEEFVLGRQKRRTKLIETVFIDSSWDDALATALEERDEAIAQEVLTRQLSATKKKAEPKKK